MQPPLRTIPSPDSALALWLCPLERDPSEEAELFACLSATEQARAARFGTLTLRRRWMTGRATLRWLLGHALGCEPAAIPLRRGVRGRPELDTARGPDFNVSHTGEVALICIGTALERAERVGVDIERVDRRVNTDGLSRRVLTEHEREALAAFDDDARRRQLLRLWTCKEAMSKATGDALSAPFRRIHIATDVRLRLISGPEPYTPGRWRLLSVAVPEEFFATLAVWRSR